MTEIDKSIRQIAEYVANHYKADFDLTPPQEKAFIDIAEKEIKQSIGKHTLPGVKISTNESKELMEQIEVKLALRFFEFIGAEVTPTAKEIKQHLNKKRLK